jgi:rhodanese-related sulfurtransferase
VNRKNLCGACLIGAMALVSFLLASGPGAAENPQGQAAGTGIEISMEELRQILLTGKTPVIDVRPQEEYAISHIPGSVNIFETEIAQMMKVSPDKSYGPVLYCNGPYCHKTSRVAEKLTKNGYTNIMKFKGGLPVWRALGNAAETGLSGFKYVFTSDKTAVFIDARSRGEYKAGTLPGAVNLQTREIEAANNDGRLPYKDHGTRIIIFGAAPGQARQLAEAVARRAYWNSSYFSGAYEELKQARDWRAAGTGE